METHQRNGKPRTAEELPFPGAPCWVAQPSQGDITGLELFDDQYGHGHAKVPVRDHHEILRLQSKPFRHWLMRHYIYQGRQVGQRLIRERIDLFEALASLEVRELHNRSAWSANHSALFIDLANSDWKAVRVDAAGWAVTDELSVYFRRFVHQRPLPYPDRAGDLREVLDFLPPLRSEGDALLVLVWIVAALAPMPRPILMPIGPNGSAKNTFSAFIRRLVEPSQAKLLGHVGHDDLPLTFYRHAVAFLDNVDALTPQESDLFCQGVTGRAIDRRRLYTDNDEFLFSFERDVILNGLRPPTNRPDLLDRTLIIELDRLTPERRRTLDRIAPLFQAARPRLFGGLLNALSQTLDLLPTIAGENLSRMADFHRYGRAAAVALGYSVEQFDAALKEAESRQNRGASDNTLAVTLLLFIRRQRRWDGDAPTLLERLVETAKTHQICRSPEFWPDTPIGFGRHLKQLGAALAEHGLTITHERRAHERLIHLEYDPATDSDRGGED